MARSSSSRKDGAVRTHWVSIVPFGQERLEGGVDGIVVGVVGSVVGGVVTGGGVVGDPEHARKAVRTTANAERRKVNARVFNAKVLRSGDIQLDSRRGPGGQDNAKGYNQLA